MRLEAPLQTVTTTVDGEVLTVLARAEHWFGIGDLARLIPDRSREGLRKSLRRLVEQGVVEALPVGSSSLFRLDREHLAAPAILALASLRATFVDRLRTELSVWEPAPAFAAIFGSAAQGAMGAGSDVDLFLLHPGGDAAEWDDAVDRLSAQASRWIGNDVRPLVMTTDEIADAPMPDPVLKDVLGEGITVVGDRATLRSLMGARR